MKHKYKIGNVVYPADGFEDDLYDDAADGMTKETMQEMHGIITDITEDRDGRESEYEVTWVDGDGEVIDTYLKSAWWTEEELTADEKEYTKTVDYVYERLRDEEED